MNRHLMNNLLADLAPCVADLGARGGLDEDLLAIAWATHAIGFEPDAAEARRLSEAGDPRWEKVTILPYAIAGHTGPAILYVPESPQGASLLRHNAGMTEYFGYENLHVDQREVPIDAYTLDDLRKNGKLPRIDYLKIDIEGAELEVLQAGKSVISDCVAVKVECSFLPQRLGQPLVWDVIPWLLTEGFAAVDIIDVHRWRRRNLPSHPYHVPFQIPYSRGQIAQCDMILLKAPEAIVDRNHALRLVIISAALGYYDYAITILRTRPDLSDFVEQKFGCNLEAQLGAWSRQVGKRATKSAIRTTLRSMIPLFRSVIGKLPYSKPVRPY